MPCRHLFVLSLLAPLSVFTALAIAQDPTPSGGVPIQAEAAPKAPVITLLEAGAAERKVLRYQYADGRDETMKTRQKISMVMEMSGMTMPQELPATIVSTRARVGEVAADGSAKIETEITAFDLEAAGADPMTVDAMRQGMAGAVGMRTTHTQDTRGRTSNFKSTLPENADPELRQQLEGITQSMEQVSAPFPEEALGVGGRWSVAIGIEQGGMKIDQVSEYEVLEFVGDDEVVLKVTIKQSAKPQTIEIPQLPDGATAKLKKMESTGEGTMRVNLRRLAPKSEIKLQMALELDIDMMGSNLDLKQSMRMELTVTPADAQSERVW